MALILAHFAWPLALIIRPPFVYFGLIFVLAGLALNLWSDMMLKASKTTVKPFEDPTELETTGPYKISRNPMYLGMVLALFGGAISFGSVTAFIFPVLYIFAMNTVFIVPEEENLEKIFGKKYMEYTKQVRRWI